MKTTLPDDGPLVDADVIDYVTRSIVEHFHPERVILFGSHARGDARRDSDLDICVVMHTTARPPQRMIDVASIFRLPSWPMDIVVFTPEEYEERRPIKGSFAHTIDTEGRVLHDAGISVQSVAG